jgi:hypothetical protein
MPADPWLGGDRSHVRAMNSIDQDEAPVDRSADFFLMFMGQNPRRRLTATARPDCRGGVFAIFIVDHDGTAKSQDHID